MTKGTTTIIYSGKDCLIIGDPGFLFLLEIDTGKKVNRNQAPIRIIKKPSIGINNKLLLGFLILGNKSSTIKITRLLINL